MDTTTLNTKKMEVFREILNIDDENILLDTRAYTRETKKPTVQTEMTPPEGYMTGDEFEKRVKKELKQLYKEHGLL